MKTLVFFSDNFICVCVCVADDDGSLIELLIDENGK